MQDQVHDSNDSNPRPAPTTTGEPVTRVEVDERTHGRNQISPEAGAEGQTAAEIIDLTQSPPPAEAATQGSTISGSNFTVTTQAPRPTWASTSPAQLPTLSELEVVDGLGHVRRVARPLLEAATPAEGTWEAAEAGAVRPDAVAQGLANMYWLPESTYSADARQHNSAPFEFVNPLHLHTPWVKLFGPGELQGVIDAGDGDALEQGGNLQGFSPSTGSGAQQLPSAGPLDHEEGQAGPSGTSYQYPDAETAPSLQPEPQVPPRAQSLAPQQVPVFPAGLSSQAPALRPAMQTPRTISMQSSDDQVRARLQELTRLITAEAGTHASLLHALIADNAEWRDQPYEARSRHQLSLWFAQVQTFVREFMARHDIDLEDLEASNDRFDEHPMARMRQLIEMQMRRVNGLPQTQLSIGEEMRLRRVVLEAQLRTLEAWTRNWRDKLPQGYQEQPGEVEVDAGGAPGGDEPTAAGGMSAEEMERMAEFARFMES